MIKCRPKLPSAIQDQILTFYDDYAEAVKYFDSEKCKQEYLIDLFKKTKDPDLFITMSEHIDRKILKILFKKYFCGDEYDCREFIYYVCQKKNVILLEWIMSVIPYKFVGEIFICIEDFDQETTELIIDAIRSTHDQERIDKMLSTVSYLYSNMLIYDWNVPEEFCEYLDPII